MGFKVHPTAEIEDGVILGNGTVASVIFLLGLVVTLVLICMYLAWW